MSDGLSELLKLAGRRPVPDEHHMARARAAAHSEWKRVVRGRRWGRPLWVSAIAATVAAAVLASAWLSTHRTPTPGTGPAEALAKADIEVATLQMVTGGITVTPRNSEPTRLTSAGLRLRTGDRVETAADSRAMLVLSGGTIVKVDRNTQMFVDRGVLTLARGALYVDAGPEANDRDVVVQTPLAKIRHLGTQFEVRLDRGAVKVRVREGEVAMVAMDARWGESTSSAGSAMGLTAAGFQRDRIATYGPEWNWVAELPRPFTLEGATLRAFLDWVSREQGWQWQYQDEKMRERVDTIVQRGSVEGLTAQDALERVLRSNELAARPTEGRLVIVRSR